MCTILIVEDETAIQALIQHNLEAAGFDVIIAEAAEDAFELLAEQHPYLLLLDWMLPGLSGLDLCKRLRQEAAFRELPIIMLTVKGEEEHRIRGLEIGADDYIAKPFSPRELIVRINNLLRRSYPEIGGEVCISGSLRLYPHQYQVFYGGVEIQLSLTEFRLLQVLVAHPGQVYERNHLLDRVWGPYAEVEERTVDVHIRRLRKALELSGVGGADFIQTVRGVGYRLAPP